MLVKIDGTDYNTQWATPLSLSDITGADPLSLSGQLNMAGDKHIELTQYADGTDPSNSDATKVLLSATNTAGASTVSQFRITTSTGYLEIGPRNASFCHFYTDMDKFYFNKEIQFDSGSLVAYNDDLQIQTDGTSSTGVTRIFVDAGVADARIGLGNGFSASALPQTECHVAGTIRQTAATDSVIRADSNGDLKAATIGNGLSFDGTTLADGEAVLLCDGSAPANLVDETIVFVADGALGGNIGPPTFLHRKGINATLTTAPTTFDSGGTVMIVGFGGGAPLQGGAITLDPGSSVTVMAVPAGIITLPGVDGLPAWLITGHSGTFTLA